jgi:hypothetical protein
MFAVSSSKYHVIIYHCAIWNQITIFHFHKYKLKDKFTVLPEVSEC